MQAPEVCAAKGSTPDTCGLTRWCVEIHGVVQGVGFRPFVHRLARELCLSGWVQNTTSGVRMEIQGGEEALNCFVDQVENHGPPLTRILSVDRWATLAIPEHELGLEIRASVAEGGRTLVSPDVATCAECLEEVMDSSQRRYGYAFTNCTNCGPRFSIIVDLPYDRPLTTMAKFDLCPECAREYGDSADRRFHAQPVACPRCGPEVWFEVVDSGRERIGQKLVGEEAIRTVADLLDKGGVVAVKSVGGFHLCCRADHAAAVRRLRDSKFRPSKPFAVMVRTVDEANGFCEVCEAEVALLKAPEAPIVLLRKKRRLEGLSSEVAPGNGYVGVILPYSPLHHLLLAAAKGPLVMTSGNRSGEPLCTDNAEAVSELRAFVDGFLLNDRPIARRCDDSVMCVSVLGDGPQVQPVRRSRGLAPLPVLLPVGVPSAFPMVAVGADLKNVSAVAVDRCVFMTSHIGDLSNLRTREEQARAVADFERMFRVQPEMVVCDMHPGYASTRYAEERAKQDGLPLIEVQHHHAHIAGCLAENGRTERVIGLSFDGTGYGIDGRIWGGEVLLADLKGFTRPFHLEYLPLPGGDAAIRKPYRIAMAYAQHLFPDENVRDLFGYVPEPEARMVSAMLNTGTHTPLTSSMGRLFDAVSALVGLCRDVTHEAQAAIALEAAALEWEKEVMPYPFSFSGGQIRVEALFGQVVADVRAGADTREIARRFHATVAEMAVRAAEAVRETTGVRTVALSGGVWQNRLLLETAVAKLLKARFEVLTHHSVPANDGGIAYGQVAVAAARMKRK